MQNDLDKGTPYYAWLDRKFSKGQGGKPIPAPIKTLMRRTLNTACSTVNSLKDIPFERLSFSLYFFCKDIQTQDFAKLYESQIELAGANEERFVKGLHKFYVETSARIKKENLYHTFFAFLSTCIRIQAEGLREGVSTDVVNCYQCLLMQNLEYLRPKKFDFSTIVCGIRTDGVTVMDTKDCLPNLDAPAYELEADVRAGKLHGLRDFDSQVPVVYSKYGFKANSLEDVDRLNNMDRINTTQLSALLPFINEYTFDILPVKLFSAFVLPFHGIQVRSNMEELIDLLKSHRSKTLPANGVLFKFKDDVILDSVLFKEIFYDNSIYMLYRAETSEGDLSGYYDTKRGFLYSIFADAEDRSLLDSFKKFILYLYACVVTRQGSQMLANMPNICHFDLKEMSKALNGVVPIEATPYIRGGKLKNVYDKSVDENFEMHRPLRKGNENYVYEERSVQGFIRKVGEHRHASENAIELAKSLGYELEDDETYVQPFIKQVLKLKAAQDEL